MAAMGNPESKVWVAARKHARLRIAAVSGPDLTVPQKRQAEAWRFYRAREEMAICLCGA